MYISVGRLRRAARNVTKCSRANNRSLATSQACGWSRRSINERRHICTLQSKAKPDRVRACNVYCSTKGASRRVVPQARHIHHARHELGHVKPLSCSRGARMERCRHCDPAPPTATPYRSKHASSAHTHTQKKNISFLIMSWSVMELQTNYREG